MARHDGTARRPSMRDVADLAGVSVGTVSYAINRPQRVTQATRQRVLDAVDQLGFVPNSAARSMKSGGATGLGIVVGDIRHTFSIELARGAQQAATEAGTTMVIANGNTDMIEQSRYVEFFDQARMEGIIIVPTYDSQRDIDQLHAHRRRVVIVNYRSDPADVCAVLMDNEDAGRQAAAHLIGNGDRRLAFVTRTPGLQPLDDRRVGIEREVAATAGASLRVIETPGIYEEDGRAAAAQLAATPAAERPTGVIVGTALVAAGLLEGLNELGLRVPEDVAVVCTEENRQAELRIPVTTVREPAFEMGRAAAGLAMMEANDGPHHAHRTVVLRATLEHIGPGSTAVR